MQLFFGSSKRDVAHCNIQSASNVGQEGNGVKNTVASTMHTEEVTSDDIEMLTLSSELDIIIGLGLTMYTKRSQRNGEHQ